MTDLWNPAANDGKGGIEYVPHTEAKDKLAQGYQLPIGRTLALVRPDGSIGKAVITKENAEAAAADLRAGARFASDDEVTHKERSDEYSDQNFKAALVGAANEATMGALGLVASEVAPSVAKDIRGLQEFSPVGYGVGSVAGAVLPALATGGTSAAARTAQAGAEAAQAVRATTLAQKLKAGASAVVDGTKSVLAATPQGALATAAEAAEAAALGKGFSRATAAALGYGLEGAAYGGIRTATEDALHNRELSAESFVINAALGGILGGGVGAGARVVPGALSKAYQGTKEGLKNLWTKKTGAELGDGVAEIATLEDVATRASRPLSEAGKRARRNIFVKSKEVGEYGSKLRQHIDQVEDVGGIAQDMMKGAAKRRNVEPLVKKGRPVKALNETMAVADDYLGFIDDLVEDGPSFGLPRSIGKQLRDRANGYREAIIKAASSKSDDVATDVFMIADGLKREIQSQANKFKRYETVFRRFEDQETSLRGLLENVDEFGEAANLQKNINATWSRLIANDNKFQNMFMEDSGEFLAYGTKRTASPQKIQGFLSGIGKFEKGLHEEVMNRQVQLQREFIETLSKYVDLDPSLSARLGTARQSASSAEKFLAEASEVMRDRNQYLELTSRPAAALFGGGVGGVLGYAGSGGEGEWALAGSAAGVLMNPAKRIQALAHWDSMAHMFTDKARKATQGYVKGLQRAKTGLVSVKPTAKDVEKAARGAYKPLSHSEYKKAVDAIKAYAADPRGVEEELKKAAGDNADAAPGTFGASVGVQMRALNYLASKIPESSMHTPEILPPKKRPPSEFERLKFSRIIRTLQKPERLLDDLKEGRLSRDAVAVKTVYPAMHAQIVETVIDEVQNAPTGAMTYQDKINLSFLLDVPLDKSMEPKHIAAIQSIVHGPSEEQQEPGGGMVSPSAAKAPNQAALSQTMSQGLIEEGY
ncbi:MAG: hypothetical protein IPL86_16375 [Flavobacteriales bacterium]|nr:hypothetical protein [Flavobacteriales bacterium]